MIDFLGKDASGLRNKRLFLFDMDGTIYKEETVYDGTHQMLELIEQRGGKYVFITNNSSKSVTEYIKKINRLGIKGGADYFFTSVQATILYLKKIYPGKKVYCQGTKSFVKELADSGIQVTEEAESDVDIVLVGFDTELTSSKLRKSCELLLRESVPFIATNPDLRCPVDFGYIPDCGSICNMITAATDRIPTYIGKPEPIMVNTVREKFGCSTDETIIIGDRLYTDIAAGLNANVEAICVLTGEATIDEIRESNIKPTYVFESVKDIWKVMKDY